MDWVSDFCLLIHPYCMTLVVHFCFPIKLIFYISLPMKLTIYLLVYTINFPIMLQLFLYYISQENEQDVCSSLWYKTMTHAVFINKFWH